MAAHAAIPVRKPFGPHGLATPIIIGVFYGLYAVTTARQGSSSTTAGDWWLGLVSAVVLGAGIYALRRYGHVLPRELRAAGWAALAGIAAGFLYSLSGASVLSSSGLGLIFGAVNGAAAYYLFYTHEDGRGRPAAY
ncbi:hypothetical protein ACIOMM_22470 [Streptomyces sp. NPDC087908]|uniref:hypothetical protein n=1 Tax=unclassified Streptomyces TaxID=2593676 RepID=UPI0011CD9D7A|nr:hypothetical protein [Streptomyces sp. adm13(2018)]TXS16660.1 hypothetical protein EAO70_15110 [Streptomyces sp. adm13(2018)]